MYWRARRASLATVVVGFVVVEGMSTYQHLPEVILHRKSARVNWAQRTTSVPSLQPSTHS